MSERATGAGALVRSLEGLGVRHVFGVPGTQNVALFEALRDSRIRTVVPTHELAAAFMAGAYHRVSGRPGILVTIPGPGFAYTLAGLAEARLDSAAVVHVTGAPPRGPGKSFRLQELRQAAIASPMVKGLVVVERPQDVPEAVARAHAAALAGEPGPVMIKMAESAWGPLGTEAGRIPEGHSLEAHAAPGDARAVLDRLRQSRRGVVLAGQGTQRAHEAVRQLAERLGWPVVTTGSGRGALPEDHALAMGYDSSRSSVDELNRLLAAADLVLVLGTKLGHNGTAGFRLRLPPDRTVQVDTAADIPGTNYPVAAAAATTVERFLEEALSLDVAGHGWTPAELAGWRERLSARDGRAEPRVGGRTAAEFFREIRGVLPRNAVLTTDSGLHQILTRRHFEVWSPSGLLLPTDFQAMGFGIPAAVAARLAAPDRPVVALVGDGGFAMSGLELATAVREGLDLAVVVFNDGYLGQIRMQQIGDFGRTSGVALPVMDYAAFAESVGAKYATLDPAPGPVMRDALTGGVWLLEVSVGESLSTTGRRIAGGVRRLGRSVARGRTRSFLKAILRKLLRR